MLVAGLTLASILGLEMEGCAAWFGGWGWPIFQVTGNEQTGQVEPNHWNHYSFNRAVSPMAILTGKPFDQLGYITLNPYATYSLRTRIILDQHETTLPTKEDLVGFNVLVVVGCLRCICPTRRKAGP